MAENFQYTKSWLNEEDFPLLGFTRNWENPADYPTVETDEAKVRHDMQSLHDEVKDYLNEVLIPKVIAEDATVAAWQEQEDAHAEAEQSRVIAEQARAEAEQGRVTEMTQMIAESDELFKRIEKMAVAANTLPAGSEATAVLTFVPGAGAYKITFGIPRGADGQGTGDMKKSVYDPNGKQTDVFKYVDDALAQIPTPDVSAQIAAHNESADAHKDVLAPMYTYGTEDLQAGVTSLETGKLHFVYE